MPGSKGQKGKTIELEKLEDKIADGIKSLRIQLNSCCSRNKQIGYAPNDEHNDYKKRSSDYYTVTCPPYGKVCFQTLNLHANLYDNFFLRLSRVQVVIPALKDRL